MNVRTRIQFVLTLLVALMATGYMIPPAVQAQSGPSGKLTVLGSSALLPMMQEAARQFQAANPNVQITVTGGGSGAGRSQVCSGKIDIGNSDVRLSSKEKNDFKCGDAVETPVAVQAFAPVANKQGPGSVTSMSRKQLIDIFTGKVTNWKQVGGEDQAIVLINRAKGSGTRAVMARYLFDGVDKFATGDSEEDNSATVVQTVNQTPGAISYLGFAYLGDPDMVAFAIDGVTANRDDIIAGKWPIVGVGYAITKGQPNPTALAFLSFVVNASFQNSAAFSKLGFVPVNQPKTIVQPAPGAVVKGTIDISGVADLPTFKKWQLDLLLNENAQKTTSVAVGTTAQKSAGTLTKLDTTKYPNGLHTLRLRVIRADTNYVEYLLTIVIAN
ncbi:MAG: phosphate ABC transporter substrate-binding protein [Chloroflexi bacterium]|nr:phosphate ABC transporter substrate-binding protein [Chloroflexota bacterium]